MLVIASDIVTVADSLQQGNSPAFALSAMSVITTDLDNAAVGYQSPNLQLSRDLVAEQFEQLTVADAEAAAEAAADREAEDPVPDPTPVSAPSSSGSEDVVIARTVFLVAAGSGAVTAVAGLLGVIVAIRAGRKDPVQAVVPPAT